MSTSELPVVVLFSGKRKSGKDYIVECLEKKWSERGASVPLSVMRLSGPLKGDFAKNEGLDEKELLTDGPYKEIYRKRMIEFGEEMRAKDYGYWCKLTTKNQVSRYWIIPDCRRKTDLQYFMELAQQHNAALTPIRVRVFAETEIRESRGYKFCAGVDDAESECGLDDYPEWDVKIQNNGDMQKLSEELDKLIDMMLVKKD